LMRWATLFSAPLCSKITQRISPDQNSDAEVCLTFKVTDEMAKGPTVQASATYTKQIAVNCTFLVFTCSDRYARCKAGTSDCRLQPSAVLIIILRIWKDVRAFYADFMQWKPLCVFIPQLQTKIRSLMMFLNPFSKKNAPSKVSVRMAIMVRC